MGGVSPETCWSSYKYEINFDTLLPLVGFFMWIVLWCTNPRTSGNIRGISEQWECWKRMNTRFCSVVASFTTNPKVEQNYFRSNRKDDLFILQRINCVIWKELWWVHGLPRTRKLITLFRKKEINRQRGICRVGLVLVPCTPSILSIGNMLYRVFLCSPSIYQFTTSPSKPLIPSMKLVD
jgi:hypothetical protein